MWFIFHKKTFKDLITVSDVNQGLSLILPSGDFPGDGGVFPFWDVIYDKYTIMIPKQHVILLRIEWRTWW